MKTNHWLITAAVCGLLASCQQKSPNQLPEESTADTAVLKETEGQASNDANTNAGTGVNLPEWDDIDFDLPEVKLPDINLKGITTRGNDAYTVYSVDETILFGTDQATLRPNAKESLQQVASSIANNSKGDIRIYGHTDSTAGKAYNKELSEQRAQAVKQWMVQNGNVEASRISIHPMGESQPTASNQTAQGRQQNRRVDIVVRKE